MAVDRGGLQYTIEARDKFSATTQAFRQEMRASKAAFRDFQNSLKVDRTATRQLKTLAEASKAAAQAERQRGRDSTRAASQVASADRFEQRRLATLRNLRDQVKLLGDAEIRRERDARRSAAATEKSASAVEQKARAEREAAKAAKESERAEKRLADLRAKQARADLTSGERGATQQRQRELAQLREGIQARAAAAKAEADAQQKAEQDRVRRAVENQRTAERLAQAQRRAHQVEQRERERALAAEERLRTRLQRTQERSDPRVQAQRALNRELFQEQVQQQKIVQLRERARAQFRQGEFLGGAKTLQQARDLEKSLVGVEKSSRNIFFSFRRLIGILAVFTLARQAVQGFQQLIALGLRFGDTLESARVSIAGIVLATGQIRDDFGDTVEGAEALARAEGLAAQQIRQLRQDALRTTATFEELLDTFQIAVGPGLAAGLNLDEIRQLSVSISQAATAIGLPQNQLAEEIRSLLSGTIQARTTRIATVLGISNADIRRLQETGELFEFLEERFASFAASAEKQARSTLSGIRALVQGALGEVLGQAAEPLRTELLSTLTSILDDVLLIRDELGNVAPRPEVVQAFRALFEALRLGVERARELGESLGFEGLQDLLGAVGTGLVVAIEFVFGFVEGILFAFQAIKAVVDSIAETFGLTNRDLGRIAGILGVIVAAMFVWNNTAGLVGLRIGTILNGLISIARLLVTAIIRNFGTLVTLTGALGRNLLLIARNPFVLAAAGIAAIIKLTELWFEKVLDVELGFRDVVELVGIGLLEAIDNAATAIGLLFSSLQGAIDDPAGAAKSFGDTLAAGVGSAVSGVADALGFDEVAADFEERTSQILTEQAGITDGLLRAETELERKRRESQEAILSALEGRREERRQAIELIAAEAQAREDQRKADADAAAKAEADAKAAADAAKAAADGIAGIGEGEFFGTISNANQTIRELAEGLLKVQDELRAAEQEFAALNDTAGLDGIGGNVARLFTQAEIENAERIRKITAEQRNIQEQITRTIEKGAISSERLAAIQDARRIQDPEQREEALGALNLTAAESTVVSLLRDKLDLSEAIREAQGIENQLATVRAAILARQELPGLIQQNQILAATATAQERINAAQAGSVGQRQRELIAAQQALAIAKEEEAVEAQNRQKELAFLQQKASLATGEEQAELQALVATLQMRAELEDRIAAARLQQLTLAQQEAALVANGTFSEGLKEGFNDILEELPTRFEQGVAIIRGSVTALSSFISDSIVSAFDPTDDTSLQERFARFLQSIATLILNQIVQLLVATAIAKAFGVPLPGSTAPVPSIPGVADGGVVPGYARGGKVKRSRARPSLAHFVPGVRGFAGGGRAPRDPRDTVPAFLQPGEFVVRKNVVDDLGVGFFSAVNNGRFTPEAAPVAAPSGAKAASAGMQSGGLVADQIASSAAVQQASAAGQDIGVQVVPAVVAREREMDQLANGGRAGLLNFFRENAGTINGLLKRDNRR